MLVVGAGPVGLLLGCLLLQSGLRVCVVERRAGRSPRTRAIGVHPPGLRCLRQAGVDQALIAAGVKVRCGYAYADGALLGRVDFRTLTPPYDFVLSVPQADTERVLLERLQQLSSRALRMGTELVRLESNNRGVRAWLRDETRQVELEARVVVGCDGRGSRVREAMGVPYRGADYRERFVMSDAPDETDLHADAAVFLSDAGLAESFPLPARQRRWVLRVGRHDKLEQPELFAAAVRARTGQPLTAMALGPLSAFTAQHFQADSFTHGRVVLAGDAAHVLSPIGGQGMNLGWLDAVALHDALLRGLRARRDASARPLADQAALRAGAADDAAGNASHGASELERLQRELQLYAQRRAKASRRARQRSELYMALGRAGPAHTAKKLVLRTLLSKPLAPHAAEFFTMRGLS